MQIFQKEHSYFTLLKIYEKNARKHTEKKQRTFTNMVENRKKKNFLFIRNVEYITEYILFEFV